MRSTPAARMRPNSESRASVGIWWGKAAFGPEKEDFIKAFRMKDWDCGTPPMWIGPVICSAKAIVGYIPRQPVERLLLPAKCIAPQRRLRKRFWWERSTMPMMAMPSSLK